MKEHIKEGTGENEDCLNCINVIKETGKCLTPADIRAALSNTTSGGDDEEVREALNYFKENYCPGFSPV